MKKELNICNHQENANQNYTELSPYSSYNGHYQNGKIIIIIVVVWMQRMENSIPLWVVV